MSKAIVVIPARYRSTRFEGKPLAVIAGRSMLERTWFQCTRAVGADAVYVATDDDRINDHCDALGIQVVRTSAEHPTGTDRVAEVAGKIEADVYLNVQGDEPLVAPDDILAVRDAFEAGGADVVNGMCPIDDADDWRSPTVPKVLAAPDGRLLYMSRGPVPANKEGGFERAWRQVCVYAFSRSALEAYAGNGGKTPLEAIEDIEILRFLELGMQVRMVGVSSESIAVDRPGDVAKVEAALADRGDPMEAR